MAYTKIVELLVEISQPQTDESLATRTQDGDREAFGLLVERYEEKLSRYGRKFIRVDEDIEDVVQEVFIKAYRNIRSFNTAQRFSPWIYRIAHNAFVNELRRKSRNSLFNFAMDFDSLISHPQSPDTAELPAQNREMKELVEKGLGALPANYREVLLLFYEEELSYKEIADVLQVPIGTVGVRVKRAKEALAKAYVTMNIKYDF